MAGSASVGPSIVEQDTPEPLASTVHRPVLRDEVLEALRPTPGAVYLDGTVGAGGHAAVIAQRVVPGGLVLGLDRDPDMLALAGKTTAGLPVELIHAAYDDAPEVLASRGLEAVDGLLLDLGLSSDQLAWESRGFSFRVDGPLDMRFDPSSPKSAADLVNRLPEGELADLIYQFGEERHSRRIARRIVEERAKGRIESTARLAETVRRGVPGKWGAIDPATRTFQALRIAVNQELERLDRVLAELPCLLKVGGRAAILSFHSLEDRRVKWAFRNDPALTVISKKPIEAGPEEVRHNPRARSAKLRVAERCPNPT